MSKAFYQKLCAQSNCGASNKVESKFGASILKKFGWKEGTAIGKNSDGLIDPLKFVKRKERLGLGAEEQTKQSEWVNWWDSMYNNAAKDFSNKQSPIVATSDSEKSTADSEDLDHDLPSSQFRRQEAKLARIAFQDALETTKDMIKKKKNKEKKKKVKALKKAKKMAK